MSQKDEESEEPKSEDAPGVWLFSLLSSLVPEPEPVCPNCGGTCERIADRWGCVDCGGVWTAAQIAEGPIDPDKK